MAKSLPPIPPDIAVAEPSQDPFLGNLEGVVMVELEAQ